MLCVEVRGFASWLPQLVSTYVAAVAISIILFCHAHSNTMVLSNNCKVETELLAKHCTIQCCFVVFQDLKLRDFAGVYLDSAPVPW